MKKGLIGLLVATLLGCGGAEPEFSRRPCFVVIDNSKHLDATLSSAMNAATPGIFCLIRQTQKNGATFWSFSSNQHLESEKLLNAIDLNLTRIVGANNGIIVGFGNLDYPTTFFAYDRECPNCFNPDAVPVKSRPLAMDEKGHATCSTCKRVYDMNNRGFIISGEKGSPLSRYPASTTGPFGILNVK